MKLRETSIIFSLPVVLLLIFGFCMSDNNDNSNRNKKVGIVKKLRRNFRKLKKQEGALKLVGGENDDHEGTVTNFS